MMQKKLQFAAHEVRPSIRAILEAQGIPHFVEPDERTKDLMHEALGIFENTAHPVGILLPVEKQAFARILAGDGLNDEESPVGPMAAEADHLALFVATLGEPICATITQAFSENDFPIGSMLDSVASEAADLTAQLLEDTFYNQLRADGRLVKGRATLRFSPGYCGWNMSGQRSLFQALQPESIGITLNQSYLMQPIKSVSGVIITGQKTIFQFDDTFPFCRDCTTHSCRERISRILEH